MQMVLGDTEVFRDLATEFVERKSHDSSSLTNQRIVVSSCHACELRTVDRLADSVIPRQHLRLTVECYTTGS